MLESSIWWHMIKRILALAALFIASSPTFAAPCTKSVSFSAVYPNGTVGSYMQPWLQNWIRKNAKKHSNICFDQTPSVTVGNYNVRLSTFYGPLTPDSPAGYPPYLYPFPITVWGVDAIAYDSRGKIVGLQSITYSSANSGRNSGQPGYSADVTSALLATKDYERNGLINGIVKNVAKSKQ